MQVEAVLFTLTAIALAMLRRSESGTQGWPNRIRLGLIWLFGLGALRSVLWVLGASLMVAILTILGLLLAAIVFWALRRLYRD